MTKHLFIVFIVWTLSFIGSEAADTHTLRLDTQLMPEAVNVNVIIPEGWPSGTRFPVVYLLNGYDGDHTQWLNVCPDLGQWADRYGMIMVMPSGQDSWYWNSPINPRIQMESFIIKELVPYIDTHYSTNPTAAKRAITGLSMGGHGALWLAIRHPEIFGNVGSMSGAVDLSKYIGKYRTTPLLGSPNTYAQRWTQYSVSDIVKQLKPNQLNIIIDCGVDDPFASINDKLHHTLSDMKIPHDYISRPGGHSRSYWANSILYHLIFFNQAFQN